MHDPYTQVYYRMGRIQQYPFRETISPKAQLSTLPGRQQ